MTTIRDRMRQHIVAARVRALAAVPSAEQRVLVRMFDDVLCNWEILDLDSVDYVAHAALDYINAPRAGEG